MSDAKEIVAIFAKDFPPKFSYEMLEPIMNMGAIVVNSFGELKGVLK